MFLIGQYYKGLCNGVTECSEDVEQSACRRRSTTRSRSAPTRTCCRATGSTRRRRTWSIAPRPPRSPQQTRLEDHPSALANPLHTVRVVVGLFFLAFLPGLIAAPWFELRDAPSRVALIPGMSIVLTLLSGIAVLAVWRGPLTTTKAWVVVGVAVAVALGFRVGAPV